MHTTIVYIYVKPENIDEFKLACEKNHRQSVLEPGNLRFDVLQLADDPGQFVLYEAYASADDAAQHKETQHYLLWRETVADWMASPRRGVSYNGLLPD